MAKTIITDAGGTKTDWLIWDHDTGVKEKFQTGGINASVSTDDEIIASISEFKDFACRCTKLSNTDRLYFYGAGCNSRETCSRIENAIRTVFGFDFITSEIHSDILGSARALFGNESGIVALLGTGSASALYDGRQVIDAVPSLGFILGDEGGGAYFGKLLINKYFKRGFSKELETLINEELHLNLTEVIRCVYREPGANSYLASLLPFIVKNKEQSELKNLIYDGINTFFQRNINRYHSAHELPLGFIGSISYLFADVIGLISGKNGYMITKILKTPLEGLLDYHKNT